MRLRVESEHVGGHEHVVSLAGDVGLYTAPEFKDELVRVIAEGGEHVVVDLTATTFIDSMALAVLVRGVERLREREGGRLSVVCADTNIRKIFEVTGLDRIFGIYASRADALAGAGSS